MQSGVHRDTIMRLLVRVGEGCLGLLDQTMRNLVLPAGGVGTFNVTTGANNGDIAAAQRLSAPGC